MRQVCVSIVVGLMALCSVSVCAQEFWYAANGRGELIIDSTRVLVKFDYDVTREMADAIMTNAGRFVEIIDTTSTVDGFLACSLSTGDEYAHFLDSLNSYQKVGRVEPYYHTSYGSPQVVGEHVCIRFKEGVSDSEIDSFLDEFGAEIDHVFGRQTVIVPLAPRLPQFVGSPPMADAIVCA